MYFCMANKPFFSGDEDVFQWSDTTDQSHIKQNIMNKFDLNDLRRAVVKTTGANPDVVSDVLDAAFEATRNAVCEHGSVSIHGFGSFHTRILPGESGADPHGNEYEVGERITVDFNPFKKFREELEAAKGITAIP